MKRLIPKTGSRPSASRRSIRRSGLPTFSTASQPRFGSTLRKPATSGLIVEELGDLANEPLRDRHIADHRAVAALHDRALEQALGQRRGDEIGDRHRAGGFAEHGDIVRIAAERGDILAHPAQRGDHVAKPEIGRDAGDRQEAVDREPIVDRHADYARPGEGRAVADGGILAAEHEGAAVDPDHYGTAGCVFRRPDVGGENVVPARFARTDQRSELESREHRDFVMRRWTRLGRIPDALPRLGGARFAEAVLADGRRGIGNGEKRADAPRGLPAYLAAVHLADDEAVLTFS